MYCLLVMTLFPVVYVSHPKHTNGLAIILYSQFLPKKKKTVCFFTKAFHHFALICWNTHISSNCFSSQQLSLLPLSPHIAPDCLAVAKADFNSMQWDGTARRSEGPWSSALHLEPKKGSGWRITPSLNVTLSHTYRTMPIAFLAASSSPKLAS